MRKFFIGTAVGFVFGVVAAYGGYRFWVDVLLRQPPAATTTAMFGVAPNPKMHSELPPDVPVYIGATLQERSFANKLLTMTYQTADKPEQVIAFYQQKLPVLGWESQITQSYEDKENRSEMLRAKKKAAWFDVSIQWSGDVTKIEIAYHDERF